MRKARFAEGLTWTNFIRSRLEEANGCRGLDIAKPAFWKIRPRHKQALTDNVAFEERRHGPLTTRAPSCTDAGVTRRW